MKTLFKKYKHLISLLAVIVMAFCLVMLGAPVASGIAIVCLWQLSQFAMRQVSVTLLVLRCLATLRREPKLEGEFVELLRRH